MKKLAKMIDRFADRTQIELPKYTRDLLFGFLQELSIQVRDGRDERDEAYSQRVG